MAIHHAVAGSLFVAAPAFPLLYDVAQDLVNLAKLIAEFLDAPLEMMESFIVVMLCVFVIIVACFFVQSAVDVLGQFVSLPFDVFGRFVEAGFVQMADSLMQEFQTAMSMFAATTMLVPVMFVMAFMLNRFGTFDQFTQFRFDCFCTLGLSSFSQLGNVMPMSLNFVLQLKDSHTTIDLAFNSFCFFGMAPFAKFGGFAAHSLDVPFELFVLGACSTVSVAFPFFLLSSLGTFTVFAPFTVAVSLFSFFGGNVPVTFQFVLGANGQQSSTDTAGNSCCQKHSTKRHGLSPD